MDDRCPHCSQAVRRRKLTQAVVARMEIDCPNCRQPIRLNLHQAEIATTVAGFGAFLLAAALGWWLQSERLALLAIGAAMATMVALALLEHVVLRAWRRYAPSDKKAEPREHA